MTKNKFTVLHGDCLDRLKELPDNSVDSCVTDPPYGLSKEPDINEVLSKWMAGEPYDHGHGGFMGKSWDSFVPHPDIWAEVHRVLKPGGHALVFAGTRTQDLMTISLRLAGFEVRDVIEWLYFSGFPKSMDVGKAFDKRRDEDKPYRVKVTSWVADQCAKNGFTRRKLCDIWGVKNQPIQSWTERNADYAVIPTWENWLKLKEIVGFGDEMDDEVWRLNRRKGKPGDSWDQREKLGEREVLDIRNGHGREYGSSLFAGEETGKITVDISAPATELARKWDGWGTALKPAHEPIIVVRKPLIDADTGRKLTVADCVEKYGTGAINIDASRIAFGKDKPKETSNQNIRNNAYKSDNSYRERDTTYIPAEQGRFPANCVTLDSDEFYSMYFDVAQGDEVLQANISPEELSKKASKKDRNSDWQGEEISLEPKFTRTMGDGIGNREHNPAQKSAYNGNHHPTVKPTDLMAWLVRLVTPPSGVVLDPFAGSGSTLVAAKREGFGFIGIEREPEYVEIIEARTGEEANK